jgi:outer membrane protein assembly factor BamD
VERLRRNGPITITGIAIITRDYESAAFDFDNFVRTFPNSEYAEECAFMHAKCFYEDSPSYSLDQTSTIKAIEKLQLFTDRYPHSDKLPNAVK